MPQKRLQTARQPPVYPNSSPDHRACNPLTPSAVLTPSIGVHRWIRAKDGRSYRSAMTVKSSYGPSVPWVGSLN